MFQLIVQFQDLSNELLCNTINIHYEKLTNGTYVTASTSGSDERNVLQIIDNEINFERKPVELYSRQCVCWWSNTWWRNRMETFSALVALCAGNSPVCAWINGSVNNGWWIEAPSRPLLHHYNDIWVSRQTSAGTVMMTFGLAYLQGCAIWKSYLWMKWFQAHTL